MKKKKLLSNRQNWKEKRIDKQNSKSDKNNKNIKIFYIGELILIRNWFQICYPSQYRAQILRRAHEIERELEEDLDMLERVKYEADQEKNVSAEKRKIAQQYAQVDISCDKP